LVALDGDDIAGIAEYARDKKRPWRADVAVLVTDPWQRRGLGSVLMTCLIELAGRRGVTELDADVVLTNRAAFHLVHRGWPTARRRPRPVRASKRLRREARPTPAGRPDGQNAPRRAR